MSSLLSYHTTFNLGNELISCIYNMSYGLEESVLGYGRVDDEDLELQRAGLEQFEQDIPISRYGTGRCHTLTEQADISSKLGTVENTVLLNSSLDYVVFIHEPSTFLIAFNPDVQSVFGPAWFHLGVTTNMENYFNMLLRLTEHSQLDRAEARCEGSRDYSFTSCVRGAGEVVAGCRQPWHRHEQSPRAPLLPCTQLSQLKVISARRFSC